MCGMIITRSADATYAGLQAMIHRGLLGRCQVEAVEGEWHLGHVRLPIQGVSKNYDQPYHHGRWIILFVGEVFNFKELSPGAENDTAVVAEMWDALGIECFKHFDGFWSFAAVDVLSGELHVVTDYLAKKPLYIHRRPLSIASEIRGIRAFSSSTPDQLFFSSVRKWGYHLGSHTPIAGIEKLRPFSYQIFNPRGEQIREDIYGALHPKEVDLRHAIEQSVERRLISDIPVGMFLSGGLDSSIVFQIAKQIRPVSTICIENDADEEFARLIAPETVIIQLPSCAPMEIILDANEGPQDLGSMMMQYHLAEAAAGAGHRVMLSGDGADELFGGYRRANEYDSQMSDIFEELVHYHLPRLDKIMMRWTIELRCPFLSRPVIEGALALPRTLRTGKLILKKLFSGILPDQILNRAKFPLKSTQVQRDGFAWSRKLCDIYEGMLTRAEEGSQWR